VTTHGALVAVDGSAESDVAVQWAAREAALRRVPITLMHVIVPVVVTWPVRYLEADYHRSQKRHGREVLALAEQIASRGLGEIGAGLLGSVSRGLCITRAVQSP
jgi:nucleotide-binding universal stress UspA family protein